MVYCVAHPPFTQRCTPIWYLPVQSLLGFDASAVKQGQRAPIVWDYERVANPHVIIAGGSGAGKSHLIRAMVSELAASVAPGQVARFHVFDAAGDLHIPGCEEILFSEQSPYGLNPLRIDPDPNFGGVRKCIINFIRTIKEFSSTPLGVRQEACLRNVLQDVYAMFGFYQHDPSSWLLDDDEGHLISDGLDGRLYVDVPRADFDKARALGICKWDPAKGLFWLPVHQYSAGLSPWPAKRVGRSFPSLSDVLAYVNRLIEQSFLGSDQEAVSQLQIFNKAANAYQSKVLQAARRGDKDWRDEGAEDALAKAADKALDAYSSYINAIKTGRELDMVMRYDSVSTLQSVRDRIESMVSAGIFKDRPIRFRSGQRILRYNIHPLELEEKRMFVMFRLQELYAQAVKRGVGSGYVDFFIIDEFGVYASAAQSAENIINVIAQQGRKYDACLICAHQDPTVFPSGLMSSVATKIILGVDEGFWNVLINKMRIDQRLLAWITLGKTAGIQIKERGAAKILWRWVITPAHMPANIR